MLEGEGLVTGLVVHLDGGFEGGGVAMVVSVGGRREVRSGLGCGGRGTSDRDGVGVGTGCELHGEIIGMEGMVEGMGGSDLLR